MQPALSQCDISTKKSKAQKLADHLRHADHVAKSIRIRKSKIKAAGGGAFLTIPVARGALLGFYKGSRVVVDNLVDEHGRADYIFQGESGGRDGYDPDGRLRLSDNEVVNVHSWSSDDWAAMTDVDGVEWIGVTANWTRFCNHASKARNASVCTTSERFGRSHAIYASRDIEAGEEIYISYSKGYWQSRGIEPEEPVA